MVIGFFVVERVVVLGGVVDVLVVGIVERMVVRLVVDGVVVWFRK